MLNESFPNQTDLGTEDLAGTFRASAAAAKRRQAQFWLLSLVWLAGIMAVALYLGSRLTTVETELAAAKQEAEAARQAAEAALAATQGVTEVRAQLFALESSGERRAEFDSRSLSPGDQERFALKLAEAEVDRQFLSDSDKELLRGERAKAKGRETPTALYLQGSEFVASDPSLAIKTLTAAVAKLPNFEPAWAALGRAHRYAFNFKQADEALSKAIALNRTHVFTRAERCYVRIFVQAVPSNETISDCALAIAQGPNDWVPYHYRAFGYYQLGKDGEAEEDWRKAAELRDNPAGSLENLSLIHLRQRDWQKAFDNAQIVYFVDPESSWNWLFLSIAADRLGRKDAAADEARSKWKQLPRNAKQSAIKSLTPLLPSELKSYLTLD